jgi:hypothetical protein
VSTGACGPDDNAGSEPAPGLRVERFQGQRGPELIVYVARAADNVPAVANGAARVRIRCLDARGRVVATGSHRWPFTDTDGGKFDPHVHVFVRPDLLETIARCRLNGTDPPLEGRKV